MNEVMFLLGLAWLAFGCPALAWLLAVITNKDRTPGP